MATWDSKPGDSWSDGGDIDAATPVVNPDYANTNGNDVRSDDPVEEKKPQRVRKKEIEQ